MDDQRCCLRPLLAAVSVRSSSCDCVVHCRASILLLRQVFGCISRGVSLLKAAPRLGCHRDLCWAGYCGQFGRLVGCALLAGSQIDLSRRWEVSRSSNPAVDAPTRKQHRSQPYQLCNAQRMLECLGIRLGRVVWASRAENPAVVTVRVRFHTTCTSRVERARARALKLNADLPGAILSVASARSLAFLTCSSDRSTAVVGVLRGGSSVPAAQASVI